MKSLQFYEDETFGYKGIDDCENELLLKQIDHGKILLEQREDEDREAFFNRVGRRPNSNEYGSNEKLDMKVIDKDWHVRMHVANQEYGLDRLANDVHYGVRFSVVYRAIAAGRDDLLAKLNTTEKDPHVRRLLDEHFEEDG